MPVRVWKQESRNFSVSRTSRPVAGTPGLGRTVEAEVAPDEEGVGWGMRGVMVRVMA